MLPKLIDLHLPFGVVLPIYSYGLMILVGFGAAFLLVSSLARRYGVRPGLVFDIGIVAVASGFLGAKISFFLTNLHLFSYFLEDPVHRFGLITGGFDFFGGLILAVPSVYWFLRRKGFEPFSFGDVLAPGIALAHAFGRIGCFLNGCCYGFRCDSFGVSFPRGSAVYFDQLSAGDLPAGATASLPVFPTQLFESALLFLLTLALLFLFYRRSFAGQGIAFYLVAYGLIRFGLQFTRADEAIHIGPFTIWHLIALLVTGFGVWLYFAFKRRNRPPDAVRLEPPPSAEDAG